MSQLAPSQQPPLPVLQRSHTDGLTLYEACANGNLLAVKELLRDQPECTLQWLERNNYPLHAAAEHNHHLVVKEMLQHIFKNCAGEHCNASSGTMLVESANLQYFTAARIFAGFGSFMSSSLTWMCSGRR